jgi:hypothetical protein
MNYTILSARYANPGHNAAVIETEQAGPVLASERDTPELWAQMLAATEPQAYAPPVVNYAQRRRDEYNRRGVTMEAIMEGVIEYLGDRPQKLQSLMVIRDEVRADIPKDTP